MCAPAIVNLYKQTKVDLFFNMEETLSYGRQTLANFQKFSMSIEPITLSPPRFAPLTFMSWRTTRVWSMLHVLNISYFYTSLGFLQLHIARKHDRCFRDKHMFRKEFYKMLVRIFLQHKQAHLFGTIVVINNLNLIGSICFNSHRTFETHFLRQSASTEAIFSSTWNLHAKSLCSEN